MSCISHKGGVAGREGLSKLLIWRMCESSRMTGMLGRVCPCSLLIAEQQTHSAGGGWKALTEPTCAAWVWTCLWWFEGCTLERKRCPRMQSIGFTGRHRGLYARSLPPCPRPWGDSETPTRVALRPKHRVALRHAPKIAGRRVATNLHGTRRVPKTRYRRSRVSQSRGVRTARLAVRHVMDPGRASVKRLRSMRSQARARCALDAARWRR